MDRVLSEFRRVNSKPAPKMTDDHESMQRVVNDDEGTASGSKKADDPVFHPISLTGLVGDDDGSSEEGESAKAPVRRLQEASDKSNNLLSHHEKAIEECFLLAVNSHDNAVATDAAAIWHWNKKKINVPTTVDMELEQDSLRTWVPREMFLPTWAKPNSF